MSAGAALNTAGSGAISQAINSEKVRSRATAQTNQIPSSNGVSDVNLDIDVLSSAAGASGSKFKDALNILPFLFSDSRSRAPLICASVNVFLVFFLTYLSESTHSLAFRCLIFLAIFDLFSLITCLITIWVSRQPSNPAYSFGYSRCEVLSVFASTMLAELGCFIVLKEGVEHILVPHNEELDTNWIIFGTIIALTFHLFVTYGVSNSAMSYVIRTAPSSWLQEHVADVSRALCAIVPGLDKILLPRINSVVLIGVTCAVILLGNSFLVSISSYFILDSIAAVILATLMFVTMLPLSIYSGKILVQTTPSHVVGQLDKTLREVSTLDGVLEFRNEHFWTIGFNNLCGSVHVRVRRDANEQMVLAHVINRLSASAPNLTVQIVKDDWTQLSATTKYYYNNSCASEKNPGGHSHSHGGHSHGGHDHGHSHEHGGGGGGHSYDHAHSHSHDHHHDVTNHVTPDHKHHQSSANQIPSQFSAHTTSYLNYSANSSANPMKMI